MTKTTKTTKTGIETLAQGICEIRETDRQLAERIAAVVAAEISKYREAKRLDALAVEREAAMLAA